MIAIPHSAEAIDAAWLRASVRAEDAARFANLKSIRTERVGEGVATSTQIHRLRLDYAPGSTAGPPTLVVKTPSSSPAVREVARGWSSYQREVLFYREIAGTVALRIPKAYVAEFDPQTNWFVLVMEDLSPARDGDQAIGLSLEDARLALDAIVSLHARWWARADLAALEGVIQPYGEGLWIGTGARHAAAWPAFEAFVATRASPELRRVGKRMGSAVEPMMRDLARRPRTLCHGDFRADNLMFAEGDSGRTLITLDWQGPVQARGAFDVGMLLSMSVETELRRAHERDLLRRYHDGLVGGGVQDYGYDEFFQDYRRALLIGFTYVVQAGSAADMSHPRTEALFDSAVRRLDAALHDHDLGVFVD